MAHVGPPGLGTVFHPQQGGINTALPPEELNSLLINRGSSIHLANPHFSLQWKEDSVFSSRGLLECNKLMMIDSSTRSSFLANVQGTQLEMLLFGFNVAKQCNRQEGILNLMASGSKGKESSFQDLLWDTGSQQPALHLPLLSCASPTIRWCFTEAESEWLSLAYPARDKHFLEACNCKESLLLHPDGQHMHNCSESVRHHLNALLSANSQLQLPKNATQNKPRHLAMLVPYFESRRSARSRRGVTSDIKAAKTKKAKREARTEAKATRISEDREIYPNTYLHAFDCLLSVVVHRKQPDKGATLSLRKSGSQMLMDITASIAGTGIAVLLSVVYGVMGRGLPFCYPRILSAGFGLGLVWFASALINLRGTLMSICRSSGGAGGRLEKSISSHLDSNVKDIRFRAAVLLGIAFLAVGLI